MPQAPLSPADLPGKRRRHDYDAPRLATSHGASTDGPGARERIYELAEREALRSVQWGRPAGVGPDDLELAAAEDAKRIQRRLASYRDGLGCEGAADLPDDDREALGLPTTDYGTLPGPAQGGPLRESRATLVRRRWLIQIVLVAVVAALVWELVRVWLP